MTLTFRILLVQSILNPLYVTPGKYLVKGFSEGFHIPYVGSHKSFKAKDFAFALAFEEIVRRCCANERSTGEGALEKDFWRQC